MCPPLKSLFTSALCPTQGLPTMTAPGEAEAAAAALNAAGHVDAVGTPDGDALLFGATHIFHTLKLMVRVAPQTTCPAPI